MINPKALIFSGYGLNCEEETKYAFEIAGGTADIMHINDLISNRHALDNYQILALPGGFSYGDDTGSGNAFANKIRNNLWEKLYDFVNKDHLIIGICNGFQILGNLGLLPALEKKYGDRNVALAHNNSARYTVRFVDLKINAENPWFRGIKNLSLPIAHGEGRFHVSSDVLKTLKKKDLIAARYIKGEICDHFCLPANPNGSLNDIAAITDETGRILGMMPHPERAIFFTHLPHWPYLKEKNKQKKNKIPTEGPGLQIFKNAVQYFK